MRSLMNAKNHGALLLVGLVAGVTLAGCLGPKQIGEESDTNINEPEPMCMDGATKPDEDGCNTCTCLDGAWACTEKACADEDAPPAECEEGEEMMIECNACTCYQGMWACTQIGCGETEPSATATSSEPGDPTVTATETGETEVSASESDPSASDTDTGACGDGEVTGAEECDDGNTIDGDGCSSVCTVEGEDVCGGNPQDPLTIDAAAIDGDTLVLDVSYGGGCEEHDVDYCWDGAFAESLPVQVWLDVWHDAHEDLCDAFVQSKRMLDLTPLKTAWQTSYQQQSGEITVHVDGWDGPLAYAF